MTQPDDTADTAAAPAGQSASQPKPELAGAGLSATGKTADQFHPGDDGPGATYGDPGGTGTADTQEVAPGDDAADAGEAPEASPS